MSKLEHLRKYEWWECAISVHDGKETVIYPCGCLVKDGVVKLFCNMGLDDLEAEDRDF